MASPLTILAVACALAAPPALGATQEPAHPAVDEQEVLDQRPRTRLLHLANGHVLRVRSRRAADGRWEVERDREWTALPAGFVERAADEHDALAEARRRAAKLRRGDHAGRAAHARWLAGEGLYVECLRELDRVLGDDPDQADALELLGERPVPVALPPLAPDREPFFAAASRATPSVRELAVGDLARDENRPGLLEDLRTELGSRTSARRELALLALRRLFPGEEVMGLVRRAVLDPVEDVREAAGLALRDARDPAVAQPVIAALGSSHSIVRRHAATALGTMGYTAAVEPLVKTLQSSSGYRPAASNIFVGRQIAYIQDFDVEVAQGEAIADPQVNVLTEGAVLDARLLSASSALAHERSAIYDSLARLTRADVARSARAWQSWLDEHGAERTAAE